MRTLASSIAIFIALLLAAPSVSARNFRPDQVPNGPTIGCGLCHVSPNGGGTRTLFGEQVFSTLNGQDADWSALFDGDPDTDGYTSGWELGDPDGAWSIGTAHPAFTPSHPGQADSTPCGNDSLEGPEICDGATLNGQDCQSQGFDQGDLVCGADCLAYDTAGCSMAGPECGDEVIEGDEVCDGASLDGETCRSQGFDAGDIACAGDCMAYDTTGCSMAGPDCGDGTIEGDEICDGDSLGGETCQSQGFDGGDLACAADCLAFDTALCIHDKEGGGGCSAAPVTGAGAIWLTLLGLWVALGRRKHK